MPRVVHFEIHATDPDSLIAFYTAMFNWRFNRWGDEAYWLITTGPDEEPGINGGMLQRRGDRALPGQGVNCFTCTVSVDDLDMSLALAIELGATMAVPKMAVPGVGWLAYIVDPDGNILGMIQNDTTAA
ncbi:MAG: hypothetical protein HONBIEJF_01759 [Fimbriimonadaceae bacterium]|nr:hypothetical protein [Fimbriimonadaceae bacterium]